jgi:hypothetical protein
MQRRNPAQENPLAPAKAQCMPLYTNLHRALQYVQNGTFAALCCFYT